MFASLVRKHWLLFVSVCCLLTAGAALNSVVAGEEVKVAITTPADGSTIPWKDLPVTITSACGLPAFVDLDVNKKQEFKEESIPAMGTITLTVPKEKLVLGTNELQVTGYYMIPGESTKHGLYKAPPIYVVIIPNVEITPASITATESLDSGNFRCRVTPANLKPTYQWLTGADNGAWPATAGNNPTLDYSDPTADSTTVKKTRWFAKTPSRRQVVDGTTASYSINCEVTIDGKKYRAATPASLDVRVRMSGQTTAPNFQKWTTITVAQTNIGANATWVVTGQGTFSRTTPVASVNMPASSQFHAKAMVHENKHVTQLTTEAPWKDLFNADALYNNTLKGLTSTVSQRDLRNKILSAVNAQRTADRAILSSTLYDLEKGAFDAMNAVDPDFLEMDEADWKAEYGFP